MAGPLDGLMVLDLSRVLAGPSMTQLLADLGAAVIKIERPGLGDDTRHWGPPWLKDADGNETREAGYYMSANRGKQSVAVDIAQPEGAQIVRELAAKADFFVENFKVGGLARYGLDYESLKATNPALIYLSITGFGQDGPDAEQPGYDYLIQARSGLMSVTGIEDGAPGAGPMRAGVATADLQTGLMGTVGVLAALHHRHKTGEGQYIDLALLDVQIAGLANQGFNHLLTGRVPVRTGVWHPALAPYQPFETADDPLVLAVGNDSQFRALANLLGASGLADDERFATNPARNANRAALEDAITAITRTEPCTHWLTLCRDNNVPAAPINTIDQAFADEQVVERGMAIELDHGVGVQVPGMKTPLNFSATPAAYDKAPPLLGEDTDDVLARLLGKSDVEIDALRERGILESKTL